MMDRNTHKVLNDYAIAALKQKHVLEAGDNIRAIAFHCTDDALKDAVESCLENYKCMLNFATQGITDENRQQYTTDTIRKLYNILQRVNRNIRLKVMESTYALHLQLIHEKYGFDVTPAILKHWKSNLTPNERLQVQDRLFDYLWTQPMWDQKDVAQWYEFISRQNELVQPHLVSAVFLSAYEYPDPMKMELLRLFRNTENKRLHAIVMVGIWMLLLTAEKGENDIVGYNTRDISTAELVQAEKERLLMMYSVADQEKENSELAKLSEQLTAENLKKIVKINLKYTKNRIRNGMDANLNKVSMLHGCRFFTGCSHWWLPFDKSLPDFQNVLTTKDGQIKKTLSRLTDLMYDCDVDKLALLYNMSTSSHADELSNQLNNAELPAQTGTRERPDISKKHIIQNMYRFFHHATVKRDFKTPFDSRFNIYNVFPDGQGISAEDNLELCHLISENGDKETGCKVLPKVIERDGANADILLELGECLYRMGKFAQAYNYLKQADLLGMEDFNLLHKIQMCCIFMHRLDESNEYLQRIKSMCPEMEGIDLLIAKNLMLMKRYDEALKQYFRMNFEAPDDVDNIIGIIECCMYLDKLNTAEKYCSQLSEMELVGDEEFMLYPGHISMMKGDLKEALRRYLVFFDAMKERYGQPIQKSMETFEGKKSVIPEGKVSQEDFTLMHEMILFSR